METYYLYSIWSFGFISGMSVGIEFPNSEDWGDDETRRTSPLSFILDLAIVRIVYHRFISTEELEE